MWFVYGSTFNLCGPLYTGSTIFIYGWSSSLNFLDRGWGGGGWSLSFNFLDTKKAICPYTFKNMISLPLEISNELDEIKRKNP